MTCKVMGIVNVTPDSFSDGGQFYRPEEAIRRAKNLIADGADIIDLGGESTRPGATPLAWQDEWARLEPVLLGMRDEGQGVRDKGKRVMVSVDTYHPETAERAIAAGAQIINCVLPESIPEMLKLVEKYGDSPRKIELVVPFRLGDSPLTSNPSSLIPNPYTLIPIPYPLIPNIYLDPMIGFGTTREEDLALLRSVPELAKLGRVLVGASRKRIVKKLTGEKMTGKNLGGNLGIAIWSALNGASVVRVHDVKETVQALKVLDALEAPQQV